MCATAPIFEKSEQWTVVLNTIEISWSGKELTPDRTRTHDPSITCQATGMWYFLIYGLGHWLWWYKYFCLSIDSMKGRLRTIMLLRPFCEQADPDAPVNRFPWTPYVRSLYRWYQPRVFLRIGALFTKFLIYVYTCLSYRIIISVQICGKNELVNLGIET